MFRQVTGIIIMDSEGSRLAAKYFLNSSKNHTDFSDFNNQIKFEAQLIQKTARFSLRNDVEIIMLQDYLVLCRVVNDVYIYVLGESSENELILLELSNTLYQALATLTNNQITKRQVLENLDSVFLLIDELVDDGIIFEIDSSVAIHRLNMLIGEAQPQTPINQAISNAKDNIIRSFLSGSS